MSGEWWGRRMADRRAACPSSLLTCSSHWKEGTGCLPKSSEKRTGHLIMWGARNKLKIGLVFENNISVSFAMQQLIFIKKKVLEFCPGFQNHGGGGILEAYSCASSITMALLTCVYFIHCEYPTWWKVLWPYSETSILTNAYLYVSTWNNSLCPLLLAIIPLGQVPCLFYLCLFLSGSSP